MSGNIQEEDRITSQSPLITPEDDEFGDVNTIVTKAQHDLTVEVAERSASTYSRTMTEVENERVREIQEKLIQQPGG